MSIAVDSAQGDSSPLQVRLLSSAEICERALRKVGAFAINDEAADQDEMEEALKWFDMLAAELTAVRRCYWLAAETVTFSWPADEQTVILSDQMGSDYPRVGVLFPTRAWLVSVSTGLRGKEIELCRRKTYEAKSNMATEGSPEILFIDRLVQEQTASIWPVPNADDLWEVALEFQTYSRSVLGTQGNDQAGDVSHGFPAAWQRYIVNMLAADIGDGPVKKIDNTTLRDWRTFAQASLADLLAYENKEKTTRRPVTRRYGG